MKKHMILGIDIEIPSNTDIGDIGDEHNTISDLYAQRAMLFAGLIWAYRDISWWSLKHEDGTMIPGKLIAGIDTPDGQITYHLTSDYALVLPIENELKNAPALDGHSMSTKFERLKSLYTVDRHFDDSATYALGA